MVKALRMTEGQAPASLADAVLAGVGLADADVALVANEAQLRRHADGPEHTTAQHLVLVDAAGRAYAEPRRARPLIDLRAHNPVGRLAPFAEPAAAARLDPASAHELRVAIDPVVDDASPARLAFDLRRPVPATVMAALRDVEHLPLDGLATVDGVDADALASRLVELSAGGAVLHSLPPALAAMPGVTPALERSWREGYRPGLGLARDLRSVAQRAAAMRDHGGVFELAGLVRDRAGHRLLPSVSVVMSTMRPARAVQALRMLRAQTYPHLEIVAAYHGAPAPPPGDDEPGPPVVAFEADGALTFGEALASAVRRSSGDLLVKVDDDDWYGPEFVWDLVLASLYSGAQVVGKTTEYLHFEALDQTIHRTFAQECFHTQVAGGAMMLSRSDYEAIGGWRPTPRSTDRSILLAVARDGGVAYRTHGLGYVYVRHDDGHTWTPDDARLFQGSFEQWRGRQPAILDGRRATAESDA